ncbi:hypothetical protein TWF788_009072 [Orbilia oligospora]|uniref:Uncharacterized protein n=1 Tax=Orbilia oligospora TaxID=2813651 RepID=A0A7C8Q407_ORBOL|nr:hypothetical protein TWF788_009072 [Orbilia oligospora]KAF3216434.1 hypothetical protein TWF679_003049 [Orbilia oligospora]
MSRNVNRAQSLAKPLGFCAPKPPQIANSPPLMLRRASTRTHKSSQDSTRQYKHIPKWDQESTEKSPVVEIAAVKTAQQSKCGSQELSKTAEVGGPRRKNIKTPR